MEEKRTSLSRRSFLKSSALVGAGLALAACGAPSESGAPSEPTATTAAAPAEATAAEAPSLDIPFEVAGDAVNPLGLEAGTSVEGVFFIGGYGRDFLDYAASVFQDLHPDNPITYDGIQRVGEQLRPRFVGGNPPDVIYNGGAGNLDTAALVTEDQLLDLAPLMNAPSLDTPGKTFGETLFPGSQEDGIFSGVQYTINIAYTVYGIWHSQTLFEEKGWEYPKTWDAMLDMCEMIKTEGETSPWTYQGKYPGYMVSGVLMPLIYKNGGIQPILDIDNLVDGAWEAEPVVTAVNQMAQLKERDYIMPGTEGLTHTEAQAEWLQGNAVFIPCGTWLENEMRDLTPENFNMVVNPVPGAQDESTYNSIYASSGGPWFVPSQGQNPTGGLEFMRVLFSRSGAQYFAKNVSAIMPINGATEGVDLSSALSSALQVREEAGEDIFSYKFALWYRPLSDEVSNHTGELLTGRMSPDEFITAVQAKADEVKADDTITKYQR